MTLATGTQARSIHGRPYKTARRNGQSIVVEAMPRGVWMTAAQIAAVNGRVRLGIASHLSYAVRCGRLRKRIVTCECCGLSVAQWKRGGASGE